MNELTEKDEQLLQELDSMKYPKNFDHHEPANEGTDGDRMFSEDQKRRY